MQTITNPTKYFLYARKSSESDERQIQSIENQIEVLQNFAESRGLHVVDVISESKSAKAPFLRPEFSKMLGRVKNGEAQGLLVWKIDRLARNPVDGGEIQWLLQQEKIISIVTPAREHLPSDNALIFSIEASMANQYIRELKENVKRGIEKKLKKGWMPCTAPAGYLNTKTLDRGENHIIKDPERFDIIRKAWDLMLSGNYTPVEILHKLNNEWGFRTRKWKKRGGKPFSKSSIYRMFNDPFYAGIFRYAGKTYQGKHETMITIEEFDHVQNLLAENGRHGLVKHEYAYTGELLCGECSGLITATHKTKLIKRTKKLKNYTLYYCINASKKKGCSQRKNTNVNIIEEHILSELSTVTIHPVIGAWLLKTLESIKDWQDGEIKSINNTQQKAIEDSDRQMRNLTQMRLKDMINDKVYMEEKKRLDDEIVRLKAIVDNPSKEKNKTYTLTKNAILFAIHAPVKFVKSDTETKRIILNTLTRRNCSLKDKKLSIYKHKWLISIEKQYPSILGHFTLSELKKPFNDKTKSLFSLISPLMRNLVNTIRTDITNEDEYIDIPDLRNH